MGCIIVPQYNFTSIFFASKSIWIFSMQQYEPIFVKIETTQNMKANIGLSDKNSKEIAGVLNKILADEYLLYTKTRNYHWNIEGSNFTEMHLFYESQYTTIDEAIDEVAERVRQIGHYAQGRLKDFIKQSQLVEQEYSTDQKTQIQNLLDDHEAIIRFLRLHIDVFTSKYKDAGNADFVTGLMEKHEKMAWFLRSYLK